jgi:hypothetical protein
MIIPPFLGQDIVASVPGLAEDAINQHWQSDEEMATRRPERFVADARQDR